MRLSICLSRSRSVPAYLGRRAAAHYEPGLLYVETGEPEMAREEYNILTTLDQKLAEKLSVRLKE